MKKKKVLFSAAALLTATSISVMSAFAASDSVGSVDSMKDSYIASTSEKHSQKKSTKDKDNTLYQYSTINALMQGLYDGDITLGEVAKYGDTGLGTFNAVDGELTQLDGKFYRFNNDGELEQVGKDELTPFIVTVDFQNEKTIEVGEVNSLSELSTLLEEEVEKKNNFYAFKIHGTFNYMKTRSEAKQEKPYPVLTEVLADQSIWEYDETMTGTLVGFYTPNYASMFNVPGYHFHFISDDLTVGGHVLDMSMTSGTAQIDSIGNLAIDLPQFDDFHNTDLTQVDPDDVEDVESNTD